MLQSGGMAPSVLNLSSILGSQGDGKGMQVIVIVIGQLPFHVLPQRGGACPQSVGAGLTSAGSQRATREPATLIQLQTEKREPEEQGKMKGHKVTGETQGCPTPRVMGQQQQQGSQVLHPWEEAGPSHSASVPDTERKRVGQGQGPPPPSHTHLQIVPSPGDSHISMASERCSWITRKAFGSLC